MKRMLITGLASVAMLVGFAGAAVAAAPCRDSKGKFVKCPDRPKASPRCRNADGRFVKCGSVGATPVKGG